MDTQDIIHRLEAIKMEVARLRPVVAELSDPPEPSDLMDDGARQRLRELVQEQRRLMDQLGRGEQSKEG